MSHNRTVRGSRLGCVLGLVVACTSHGPGDGGLFDDAPPPPVETMVDVEVRWSSLSMYAMSCNQYVSSVKLTNRADRSIEVATVRIWTGQFHEVDLGGALIGPGDTVSVDLTRATADGGREVHKLQGGCKRDASRNGVGVAAYLD